MGVGDSMTTEEARRILGVTAAADAAALRAAFNHAVKAAHPDGGGSDDALRRTVDAYRFLDGRTEAADDDVHFGATAGAATESGLSRLEITPTLAVIGGRLVTRLPDGRRVAITLPAGLRQGDRISAKGSLLSVVVKGRPEMFVSGDDLCLTVRTNEAILRDGGRIKIKTPSGSRLVWVSRQVGTNHIVRIPGQGLPATRAHPVGSMILKLVADKPDKPVKPTKTQTKRKGFASAWAGAGGSR
jgi:curved DNA-binding protein